MTAARREYLIMETVGIQSHQAPDFALTSEPEAPKPKNGMGLKVNPCLRIYGAGPEGAKCKSCVHLGGHRMGGHRFYKCRLRGKPTHGPGTDHKVNWPACGKHEEWKA